jgi:AcrR family transcriptional regulator
MPISDAPRTQLPRGKHRLTREEVATSQRLRMLDALANAMAEKGYAQTTVADVLERAGVSRATFYEHFRGKEDAFVAAYETAVEILISGVARTLEDTGDDPLERFDRALAGYLDTLAAEPAIARTALVEVYAAGAKSLRKRYELQGRFVDLVAGIFRARSKRDRFACEMLVAAVSALVTAKVAAGETAKLQELHRPVMEFVRSGPLGRASAVR